MQSTSRFMCFRYEWKKIWNVQPFVAKKLTTLWIDFMWFERFCTHIVDMVTWHLFELIWCVLNWEMTSLCKFTIYVHIDDIKTWHLMSLLFMNWFNMTQKMMSLGCFEITLVTQKTNIFKQRCRFHSIQSMSEDCNLWFMWRSTKMKWSIC